MTPHALRLLDVVRQAESPSELEMRRVRRAIAMGAGATLATSAAKAAASAAASKGAAVTAVKSAALLTTLKGVAAIAVLTSVGAGTVWLSRHQSPVPVAVAPEVRPAAMAADATPSSTLLGELTLLQRAQHALAGGAPGTGPYRSPVSTRRCIRALSCHASATPCACSRTARSGGPRTPARSRRRS